MLGVEAGQDRVLLEDVVQLTFEARELGVVQAQTGEVGNVHDIGTGQGGHGADDTRTAPTNRRRGIVAATMHRMIPTTIRPMRPTDVAEATAAILDAGWGDRREFFDFVSVHPECRPVVAERDNVVIGTGVGTVNGTVGWIGTIFVVPGARGNGLGRALTEAVQAELATAGCRTEVLVATAMGRPIYERLGFEIQCWYRTVEAPGLDVDVAAAEDPDRGRIRPFANGDLATMARLDAAASGEDRAHLLAAFATATSASCLERPDGSLAGFVVRAPWGGGATVAVDPEDALMILQHRQRGAGPAGHVRAGVVDLNLDGLDRLERAGWTEAWRAIRMIRGEPLRWQPTQLWGQFNHALG